MCVDFIICVVVFFKILSIDFIRKFFRTAEFVQIMPVDFIAALHFLSVYFIMALNFSKKICPLIFWCR
jgi:hypothetical protein